MKEYKKPPFKTGNPKSFFGIYGGITSFISAGLSMWVTLLLTRWFVPDETVASSGRRFTEMILIIPVYLILTIVVWILFVVLMMILVRLLNIKPDTQYGSEEKEKDEPKSPSVWPYWLMVIFFGSMYFLGLFSIVREMMTRHFSGEYWIMILVMSALLGAPMTIGILRIRQADRGEKLPSFTTHSSRTQQKVSPVFQKAIIGFIFILLMGLAVLFGWQTIEFQKMARPATGVIKRWIEHGMGRGRYTVLEVQYTTPEGVTRTLESTHRSFVLFLMPNVGQTVDVLYNPNDPTDFRVNQFSEMWSQTLFCVFFAGIVLIAGIIGILRNQKKRQAPLKE
jgi:hypothetical protein